MCLNYVVQRSCFKHTVINFIFIVAQLIKKIQIMLFKRKVSEVDKLIIDFLKNGVEKLAEAQQKEFYKQKEIERFKMIKEKFEYLKSKKELNEKEKEDLNYVDFLCKHHCL